jgi:hypothetical protein
LLFVDWPIFWCVTASTQFLSLFSSSFTVGPYRDRPLANRKEDKEKRVHFLFGIPDLIIYIYAGIPQKEK